MAPTAPAPTPKLKLHYFPMPGRGETARLMLSYAGIPFEDVHISWQDWPTVKPTTPYGSLPLLEVGDVKLNQSSAINRYIASLAGLLPSDPLEVAKMDEVVYLISEVFDHQLQPTHAIKDVAEKIKARQQIVATSMRVTLDRLEAMIAARSAPFFGGDEANYADIAVFVGLSSLVSGIFDGIPTTLLDAHPGLLAFHDRVAALPPVARRYEVAWSGATQAAFRPLAATA